MFATALALLLLTLDPAPADATRLVPDPEPAAPAAVGGPPAGSPVAPGDPMVPLAAGGAAALATSVVRRRREGPLVPGDALHLEPEPLVVFVPGHGTSGPPIFNRTVSRSAAR